MRNRRVSLAIVVGSILFGVGSERALAQVNNEVAAAGSATIALFHPYSIELPESLAGKQIAADNDLPARPLSRFWEPLYQPESPAPEIGAGTKFQEERLEAFDRHIFCPVCWKLIKAVIG